MADATRRLGPRTVLAAASGPLADRLADRLRDRLASRGLGFERCPWHDVGSGAEALVILPGRAAPDDATVERVRALVSSRSTSVRHVLLVSSAAIHSPSHHHPGWVDEDHRGRGVRSPRDENPVSAAWRRLEEAFDEALGTEVEKSVLRAVAVPVAGGDDLFSRLLSGDTARVPIGFDPTVQLLAVDDLAAAIDRVIAERVVGTFHVAPSEGVPLSKALEHAGTRGRASFGVGKGREGVFLRHSFTVSGERLRAAVGFEPERSSARVAEAIGIDTGRVDAPADTLPAYDSHGMDRGYVRRLGRTLFRFLHDLWWRVEYRGLEHVPKRGKAVLVGVHRGHQPWDGVMTLHLLARELGRFPRFLIHPTLVKFPFLAPYMIRCGGLHACRENGDRVLADGEILAIYPEGVRGAFTPYRDAYRLGRFGRDEYVKFALRHGAPLVPFVTVGSAEIFPILGRIDWSWWKRFSEWPYLPITPTMSLVPLPSKWHTLFLDPVPTDQYGPEAAEDSEIVGALSAEIRERLQATLLDLRERRPAIFWGSVFDDEDERAVDAPRTELVGGRLP